jgi:flavin-dependent dehydrogenase
MTGRDAPIASTLDAASAASTRWDVIVAGAGPAGAMAALLLARAGLATLLVERKAFPRHKPCGGCLSARAARLLARVGLEDALRSHGTRPLVAIDLHHRERAARLPLPSGLSVSRWTLDAALVRAAIGAGAAFLSETAATVLAGGGAPPGATRAVRLQGPQAGESVAAASLVVAADGLAHASLREHAEFTSRIAAASRVGVGGLVDAAPAPLAPGTIVMAIGRHGYAGMVEVEAGRVNVAAAVDPDWLRERGGAAPAVQALLREAGLPARGEILAAADWLGTVPLTRRTPHPVARRLFVLGDAAGYVEPFTGEGMSLAFAAAHAVLPFAQRALAAWDASLEREWLAKHREVVEREQRWCRALARLVRHPTLTAWVVAALGRHPSLARPILAHLAAPAPGNRGLQAWRSSSMASGPRRLR